jgi:uncharacterized membrane protein YcjF (UPF0283 family)
MLGRLWKLVSRAVLVISVVVAFLFVMELIRAYQTFRAVHPWAGYGFVVVLAAGLVWMLGRLLGGWRLRPRTLKCPNVGNLDEADAGRLRRYGRHLSKYLGRLADNESLDEPQRQDAARFSGELAEAISRGGTREELTELLRAAEAERIEPLLATLDAKADREVSECVRDVMVAVAASPWPLIDAIVVIYRNGGMVSRITHIYNSRPGLREQMSIFADVVRIVATIKLASMMRNILEKAVRDVPLAGRIAEAITQAVGAGVLTSAAGHAAKFRCRAFRGWDREEAAQNLRAHLGNFLNDCWAIARDLVLGPAGKLYQVSADALKKLAGGFKKAVEATGSAADMFVRKPVTAGVRRSTRWLFGRQEE